MVKGYGKCGDMRSSTSCAARPSDGSAAVRIAINSTPAAAEQAMVRRRSGSTQNGWRYATLAMGVAGVMASRVASPMASRADLPLRLDGSALAPDYGTDRRGTGRTLRRKRVEHLTFGNWRR